ncbi:hypothetical protein E2C01_034664 [Portunus trituberculatus]|uniref:Uncharacterized protein n=1 Tax=Portunus trituberculatus TaxID=210409 RepID=A0A5B7F9C0_PORTR|nr:hypothetical protein [Portunus trituberculatus]
MALTCSHFISVRCTAVCGPGCRCGCVGHYGGAGGAGQRDPDAYLTCGRRMQMTTGRNSDLHWDCNMLFTAMLSRSQCCLPIGASLVLRVYAVLPLALTDLVLRLDNTRHSEPQELLTRLTNLAI